MEEKAILDDEKIKNEKTETIDIEKESGKTTSGDDHTSKKSTHRKKSETALLKEEIEQLKKELQEVKEQNLRLGAEFQNQRKRLNREREEMVLYANERLIEAMLPILDDFERSLDSSDKHKSFESFRNGVEMIYNKLKDVLAREGLKPIKSVGQKFDYNLHDALLMTHKEGVEPETVIEEVSRGYFFKDKVLRHAKVIVAK